MKPYLFIAAIALFIISCDSKQEISSINPENWSKRTADLRKKDSLEYGKSYLPVYSQIYSISQHQKFNLTGMISLRNTSEKDTIYLLKASYFNTHGASIRSYFDQPIYLAPMETTEIVIDETDIEGGTGSSFIIEWKTPKDCPEPLFEGVMNSLQGTQGLSFITDGKRIE